MQSELLDITIIGCLVLLFASTYRKRATAMVRSWTIGWVLILVHFVALLFHSANAAVQGLLDLTSLVALIACGVVFLLAATGTFEARRVRDGRRHWALPLIAGGTEIGIVLIQGYGVTAMLPYFLLILVGSAAWMLYSVSLRWSSPGVRALLVVSTFASTAWLVWTVTSGRQDIAVSAVLTQLYLSVCLAYLAMFKRMSAGRLTVLFGLLAWAAVFPAAEFCAHLGIVEHISPEFWNVPKYFVAFGMMLTLLEEEILAAGEANKRYRVLFDANPHPMWIYDRNTLSFEAVNDSAVAQYGFSREQFLEMKLTDLRMAGGDAGDPATSGGLTEERKGDCIEAHQKQDGSLVVVDVATHPMQSDGRDLAFSLAQDVTERRELHRRLWYQANHDLLTGVVNRGRLEEKLRETLAAAERDGRPAALLCLDLDRFKDVNDTYGHGAGDAGLKEVARRLRLEVLGRGIAARIGGEEFSLLLDGVKDGLEVEQIAAQVLAAVRAPIHAGGYSVEMTASMGIAVFPQDGRDAATLWRNADCAMYRAKRAGGNQYLCMSPEIGIQTSEAHELERSLRQALRGKGLVLHYQPLYGMRGELQSLEALIRMEHPEQGLIPPGRFVPVAEESGLIIPLGNWVLNEVCRQLAAWQRAGLEPVRVAINVSPLQITRPDFADQVMEVLQRHGVGAHLLGIEITETAMMLNIEEAARQIKALADIGVAFSVDDFGTGYSSLGQLDKLSVQSLKIDRVFVERLCSPDGTYSIVDAMISMAHSLRLEVVAEGVERPEQWECLRELNCDIVQGYLFSKPVAAALVPRLLAGGMGIQMAGVGPEWKVRVA